MIADDIAGALPELRAEAESRMTSRCTIRRLSDRASQNPTTGMKAAEWDDVHTDLPIRVSGVSGGAAPTRRDDVAGNAEQRAERIAHLPVTTSDLADDDLIEITSGDTAGLVLRVVEAAWQDQATARRVPVEQVQRPTEWE